VQLPQGAQVLLLRTLKVDGTVLEPETLDKDTVSMPGVGVGDAVEQEYLLAHASRRAASPGWTAGAFYFQVAGVADDWATYAVTAPKGTGMSVDAHNMPTPPVKVERDREIVRVETRRAPALIPEPNGPPAGTEQVPFVVVGAGDQGPAGLLTLTADAVVGRTQRTYEVEEFARNAAKGKSGLEAVRAIHSAVMERIAGRDASLSSSVNAAATLAQDRGSRLFLLKAALESAGFPARLAAVRSFGTDPAPYRFPNEVLFPYVCLQVTVPGSQPVWLDTLVRYGPFGLLPEQAANGLEAYLLPEPGRPLVAVKTPAQGSSGGREVTSTSSSPRAAPSAATCARCTEGSRLRSSPRRWRACRRSSATRRCSRRCRGTSAARSCPTSGSRPITRSGPPSPSAITSSPPPSPGWRTGG
jgi:hypothetical protein